MVSESTEDTLLNSVFCSEENGIGRPENMSLSEGRNLGGQEHIEHIDRGVCVCECSY